MHAPKKVESRIERFSALGRVSIVKSRLMGKTFRFLFSLSACTVLTELASLFRGFLPLPNPSFLDTIFAMGKKRDFLLLFFVSSSFAVSFFDPLRPVRLMLTVSFTFTFFVVSDGLSPTYALAFCAVCFPLHVFSVNVSCGYPDTQNVLYMVCTSSASVFSMLLNLTLVQGVRSNKIFKGKM